LADAGDGLEDANFTVKTANAAILRLTKEDEWMNEVLASIDTLRTGLTDLIDQIFANDINKAITLSKTAFSNMQFRAALKVAVFDFQNDRNYYRASASNGMHRDLVSRFMQVFILLISPICPHWAEKKWKDLAKAGLVKPGLVVEQLWPVAGDYDADLAAKADYLKDLSRDLRLGFDSRPTVKKGKKPSVEDLRPVGFFFVSLMTNY
jgi:leucyl-tRNA synthetase